MFSKMKFTTKLFISMIMITITTLVITSWNSLYMAKKGLMTLGEKGIIATHKAVYDSIDEEYKSLEQKLTGNTEFFSLMLKTGGGVFLNTSTVFREKVKNQTNGEISSVEIPEMSRKGIPLWKDTHLVDNIKQKTGAEATLFQFVDNKLIRIATTIKKEGQRVIGTYLPSSSPVFQAIAGGRSFIGKAKVVGEDFMTSYAPLKDNQGKIIGAIFIGEAVLSPEIRHTLQRCKIGKGYFFAYNPEGLIVEHPSVKGKNIFELSSAFKDIKDGFIVYTALTGEEKVTYTRYLDSAGIYIAVGMDHKDIVDGLDTKMMRNSLLIGGGILILAILSILLVVRTINRPLQQLAEKTALVGKGDYTITFASEVNDTIGLLTRSLAQMVENNNHAMRDIRNSANSLATASTKLASISRDMKINADESTAIVDEAAHNSTAVTSNMHSISSAMEESTINLDTIASASEEMGNTIQEIASNSARARETTEEAVQNAKESYDDIQKLGERAKSIGSITETITDISEQINLLALNATIEAARAGEAGRGFAVVANEIKELAKGTAEATGKIRSAIEAIQNQTTNTVDDISGIATVIEDVNDIVATIVTAVEEQSITTQEIVGNVAQASQGIGEINENVANSSQMTSDVSAGIEEVKAKSVSVRQGSEHVNSAAMELSQLSEKLTKLVAQFKI